MCTDHFSLRLLRATQQLEVQRKENNMIERLMLHWHEYEKGHLKMSYWIHNW